MIVGASGGEGSQKAGKEAVIRGYKDSQFGAESDASCRGYRRDSAFAAGAFGFGSAGSGTRPASSMPGAIDQPATGADGCR
jgi:hypothetical protein